MVPRLGELGVGLGGGGWTYVFASLSRLTAMKDLVEPLELEGVDVGVGVPPPCERHGPLNYQLQIRPRVSRLALPLPSNWAIMAPLCSLRGIY